MVPLACRSGPSLGGRALPATHLHLLQLNLVATTYFSWHVAATAPFVPTTSSPAREMQRSRRGGPHLGPRTRGRRPPTSCPSRHRPTVYIEPLGASPPSPVCIGFLPFAARTVSSSKLAIAQPARSRNDRFSPSSSPPASPAIRHIARGAAIRRTRPAFRAAGGGCARYLRGPFRHRRGAGRPLRPRRGRPKPDGAAGRPARSAAGGGPARPARSRRPRGGCRRGGEQAGAAGRGADQRWAPRAAVEAGADNARRRRCVPQGSCEGAMCHNLGGYLTPAGPVLGQYGPAPAHTC